MHSGRRLPGQLAGQAPGIRGGKRPNAGRRPRARLALFPDKPGTVAKGGKRRPGRPASQLPARRVRCILSHGLASAARGGEHITADRCMEIARAAWHAVNELSAQHGRSNVNKPDVIALIRRRCNCRRPFAESALRALAIGPDAAIADFISSHVTARAPARAHLRILSPGMLGVLDRLIQTHLINPVDPCAAGVSVDTVANVLQVHAAVTVGRMTAWRAMCRLGYHYCKLSRKVRLTSKRKSVIEDYIRRYDAALQDEAAG